MEQQEIINKTFRPDSIEFGTPATGHWKCYIDVANEEEAKHLIDNQIELFEYAQTKDEKARK